jgi:hypothetical protein
VRADRNRRYGSAHRRLRAELAPLIAAGGVRCARGAECKWRELVDGALVGGLILSGQPWDLGHVDGDDFTHAGAEHAACNRAGRRRQPELEVRECDDGYFRDASGRIFRADAHGGYALLSRAW